MLDWLMPLDRRPSGWRRALLRVPILLYRLGLGALLGHRFAMIAYRGARTGRLRRVVLEVVRWDPRRREVVVASGWGDRSAWYAGLRKAPALEVRCGGVRFVPVHRFLDPGEAAAEMAHYARRHPTAGRTLAGWMLGHRFDGSPRAIAEFAERIPMVVLRRAA